MKSSDCDDSCKSSCKNHLKAEFRVENFSLSYETNPDYMKKDPEEILEYFHSSMVNLYIDKKNIINYK